MAKRAKMSKADFETRWRKLPKADRQFISAVILVNKAVADGRLRFRLLPPALERDLKKASRDTLFSIITVCLGMLTHAPAYERVLSANRRRAAQTRIAAPEIRGDGHEEHAGRG